MIDRITAPWRILGLLCVVGLLNYGDRALFSAVLAPLRADLGLTNPQIGLLSSVFLWSYALACPVAGILADRYSRATIVVASLAIWSAVTIATGMATGFALLVGARVVFGVAQSLYLPAGLALIGDHHRTKSQGRAFSYHSVALNIGTIVGATGAGFLAEKWGWRWGFWLLGGVGLVVALIARKSFAQISADTVTPLQRPRIAEVFTYLARLPTFHLLVVKIMMSGFAIWTFLAWLPLYFREVLHLNLGAAGFAGTSIIQLSFVIGLAFGGWLSDRWFSDDPRRRLLMLAVCYLCAAPFLLTFLSNPGLVAVSVAIALFSFLRGMGDACEKPALCAVVPPRYRASAIGLMNTVATANGGIGVFLVGLFKDSVTLNSMFAYLSAFVAVAGLAAWIGARYFMARDVEVCLKYAAAVPPISPEPARA